MQKPTTWFLLPSRFSESVRVWQKGTGKRSKSPGKLGFKPKEKAFDIVIIIHVQISPLNYLFYFPFRLYDFKALFYNLG